MSLLTNIAVLLVITCISLQLMVANCQVSKKKGMKKKGTEARKDHSQPKPSVQSSDKNSRPNVNSVFKGKFSTKDKTQCTWVATGANAFVIGVNCKKEGKMFECEYSAIPSMCPGFESNAKAYWKQIARALKKQKSLCMDSTVLIKANMCRNAPSAAHFKLNKKPKDVIVSPVPRTTLQPISNSSEATSGAKSCAVHHKKLSEDYCAESWSSLCAFLFGMIQNDDC